MNSIRWFKDLTIKDIPSVGGKNASLGEMYSKLTQKGVPVPNGFAITAEAYRAFISDNKLDKKIKDIVHGLDVKNVRLLSKAGSKVREMILKADFSEAMKKEVLKAYKELGSGDVAVRSSATAEDLPDASFAGQQESYLNVKGDEDILLSVKKCVASLFTDRAISYREAKGFDHLAVALSVGVQQMVRSDLAESGVMFTLDTESGFNGVVLIDAAYGLGEYIVKGRVTPDQFYVFKEGLKKGKPSIISRTLGRKDVKLVYGKVGTKQARVGKREQNKYAITDEEVLQLAKWGLIIEEHYKRPMDIEWAKDGKTKKLFIVQARPETVKSQANVAIETYELKHRGQVLAEGTSVGQRIGQGKVRIINSVKEMRNFKPGEVLVARITDPDWEPIMRIASAVVTEQGGKTSHAAIVSRELSVPCIVGAHQARQLLKNGKPVTVSCAEGERGYVYDGLLPFEVNRLEVSSTEPTRTKVRMIVGDPGRAFSFARLPHEGVGLLREEFIFTNFIKIHPLALINYHTQDADTKKKINALTRSYADKTKFLVDKLAEGVAIVAASAYPHQAVVRLSDFKTNEYATLIGGKEYEPKEENPMLGWRGASRYYDPKFRPAFELECAAIKKARETWGLDNIVVMVPFCRTVEEGKKVLEVMEKCGLKRGVNGLEVYVMCEIPANVILADEFAQIFDGFSIGSNDLTQLTLGVDRDSALVAHVFDENNAAIKKLIRDVIKTAHQYKRKVGICGQAPSEYPEFAEFLVQEGIDSISLNPDTVVKTRLRIVEAEKKLGVKPSSVGAHGRAPLPMASKAATVLGLIGLFFMLVGYTCQPQGQTVAEAIKQQVAEQVLQAKLELKQEMKKEREAEMRNYKEETFADFNLKYPAAWEVAHFANRVVFSDGDGKHFFSVGINYVPHEVIPPSKWIERSVTTTVWQGYNARRLEVEDIDNYSSQLIYVLQIFTKNITDRAKIIQIEGDKENFEKILNSIQGFKIK